MKVIVKTERKITTVRTEFKVPEDTKECNSLRCEICAYNGGHIRYPDCLHRTVMDYLERMEDDEP